jgi:hypothetical protein
MTEAANVKPILTTRDNNMKNYGKVVFVILKVGLIFKALSTPPVSYIVVLAAVAIIAIPMILLHYYHNNNNRKKRMQI